MGLTTYGITSKKIYVDEISCFSSADGINSLVIKGSFVSNLIVSPLDSSVYGIPILNAFCFKNCFYRLLYSILLRIFATLHITLNRVVFPVHGPPTIIIPDLSCTASYNYRSRIMNRSDEARPDSERRISAISFILKTDMSSMVLLDIEVWFDVFTYPAAAASLALVGNISFNLSS